MMPPMPFDPSKYRPKRGSAGSEIRFRCPRLHDGKKDKRYTLTLNRYTGSFYCHQSSCHWSGTAVGYEGLTAPERAPAPGTNEPVPDYAHAFFKARGLDPALTIRRYKLEWRGHRILWPGDPGYAGRATLPDQAPKQLCMDGFSQGKGSLIGVHLLYAGAHVAVCQGDYGAASIPCPWVGVGTQGISLTPPQAARIVLSRPASVTLCGDGGETMEVPEVLERSGIQVRRVAELPPKMGMDDLPMRVRVMLLLSAEEV